MENRRMRTSKPVGLANTRISAGYSQKSPRSLHHTHMKNTRAHVDIFSNEIAYNLGKILSNSR